MQISIAFVDSSRNYESKQDYVELDRKRVNFLANVMQSGKKKNHPN